MKMSGIKKFLSGLIAGFVCISSLPAVATEMSTHAAKTLTTSPSHTQETGWYNDYHHEIWQADTPKSSTMTLNDEDGGFSTTWKCGPNGSQGNFLARRGLFYGLDNPNQWEDYGGFTCEFDCTWSAGSSGNSRICIYGWTQNPLVEYYIIEDWKNWSPAQDQNAQYKGSAFIDGSDYKIYTCARNSYTIEGNKPFTQYISIRQNLRTSGTISISEHFKAWEALGMEMGNFYETAFNVEGWESDGSATVHCTFTTGETTPGPQPTVEPDENGDYVVCTFEDGKDNFSGRGSASVATDSDNYYAGSKSLAVTGRQDNWNGGEISLSSSVFKAGSTYSFSTAALQNSGEATTLKFTLQYTSGGEEKYAEVASATAPSGQWTKLENTSFTIPTGASSMKLYVEAPDSLTDIYIDEVHLGIEGRQSPVVDGGGTVKGAAATTTTTSTTTTTTTSTTQKSETTTTTTKPATETTSKTTTAQPINYTWGDANCDGSTNMSDAVAIMRSKADPDSFTLSAKGAIQGDVIGSDGITNLDALTIQQFEAGIVTKLPVDYPKGYDPSSSTTPPAASSTAQPTTAVQTSAVDTTSEEVTHTVVFNPDTVYISNSFDNGIEGWEPRGNTTLKTDSDSYYAGSKSLYVTGRSDAWQGAAISLDGIVNAGETYSISAAVMQPGSSDVEMKLSLQYKDASGETCYDNIAKATAKSKEWTAIGNTEYTVPEGATNLLFYVETTDSLTNFYLDNVQVASKGMKSDVTTGSGTVNVPEIQSPEGVDISWIDPSKPMVAISFDDGTRDAANEQKIINTIAENGFHATFFYVGDWITSPETVQYAYSKGMEIANHTTTHPYLTKISESEIRSEYDNTTAKLKNIIGAEPSKLMRLPFLDCNDTVKRVLSDVPLISCAIDTADWNGASKDAIVSTIKNAMNNGSLNGAIVLCHENYSTTSAAMAEVIPYLKAQGWQVVTISEMFAVKGQELNGGTVYTRCA
ncbi:MAG: glycoside hydrolase family 11 protein [Ruminococcus sp.]|nr:glycoside hydrolase family 11 protein [Ruminococcus sp.]